MHWWIALVIIGFFGLGLVVGLTTAGVFVARERPLK